MTISDLAFIIGLFAAISGMVCLFRLRQYGIRLVQVREELQVMLRQHQTEYQERIGQVAGAVEFLEKSAQSTKEALGGGLTRSLRSQAMHLLRSGMSPDAAATAAGMARRDMHLIATVSRILSSFQ